MKKSINPIEHIETRVRTYTLTMWEYGPFRDIRGISISQTNAKM